MQHLWLWVILALELAHFCDVKTGKPENLDPFEPYKISNAVNKLNLKHVVITSVDRDDLDDGGSNHFYEVITATSKKNP